MRSFPIGFAAVACLVLVSSLGAQQPAPQTPAFQPGAAVDVYSFEKWIPCTVASPLAGGVYNVRCGSIELRAKADAGTLRPHVERPVGVPVSFGVEMAPPPSTVGATPGARYGTREPRTCDNRKAAFSSAEAKDLFICDAEHEFGGSLYLVSDVSVEVASPRPFNPALDGQKTGIDPAQPVYDLHATYNNYKCNALPASHMDYPNVRNCDQTRLTNAAGGCYKNTAGEWHCLMFDFHPSATATAMNVKPPTWIE